MLENPSRSVILIALLITISVGLLGWATVGDKINLGLDLKGGTSLIYRVDIDAAKADGLIPKEADADLVLQETVDITYRRLDPTGVMEATIAKRGTDGFGIELPGMSAAEALAVKQRIQNLGRLEMRIVATPSYTIDGPDGTKIERTFDLSNEQRLLNEWLNKDGNKDRIKADPESISLYNNRTRTADNGSPHLAWYPSLYRPKPNDVTRWEGGSGVENSVRLFDAELGSPPANAEVRLVELAPINVEEVAFFGHQLDASGVFAGTDPNSGRPCVYYQLLPKFQTPYADWSEKYIGKQSAIILNGFVDTAPVFQGRIPGNGIITMGSGSLAQANELAKVLKTGSLQVRPELMSETQIGASLGEAAITRGKISMAIGGLAVILFMMWYYRTAGIVAVIALALNVLFLMAAMVVIRATLTLPGIAGIVLTLGMAVDANILIYERIREEVTKGKALLQAVRAGFDRALLTIVDSNLTTFLAGLVLYNVGAGAVKGFAVTLMIGIASSVFTAYFVAKVIFHYLLAWDKLKDFRTNSWFADVNYDWIGKRKLAVTISASVILFGLLHFAITPRAVSMGLDFTGGASLRVALREGSTREELKEKLLANEEFRRSFPDPQIVTAGATDGAGKAKSFSIKLKLTPEELAKITEDRRKAALAGQNFEPAYLRLFSAILASNLVASPFDNTRVDENPDAEQLAFGSITVHFLEPVKKADLQAAVAKRFNVSEVKVVPDAAAEAGTSLRLTFDVPRSTSPDVLFERLLQPLGELKNASGAKVELSRPFPEASEIGGRIVGEFQMAAIGSLILSWFLIALYVRIRFHEYKYGIAAVVALVHDVLVTFGVVVLFNRLGIVSAEIDMNMIAAALTIIGYSINDTIVVFDRVRENLSDQERLGTKESYESILNRSVNQTFSRTILTTGHTLFVVLAQFLVNYGQGGGLEGFAFALLVGFIAGTYSTVFIAAPVVLWLKNREKDAPPAAAAPAQAPQPA